MTARLTTGWMTSIPLLVMITLILNLPGHANGHDGATGIVKKRHDSMNMLRHTMKSWAAGLKAGQVPDQVAIAKISSRLSAGAGPRLLALFQESGSHDKSDALPIIWTRWDAFEDLAMTLEEQALSLMTSRADLDAQRSALKGVAQVCRECHDQFRKR
jgi:cytochrome c556